MSELSEQEEYLKETLGMVYRVMSSKEYADSIANYSRNVVEALKEKGFSDSDALEILLSLSKSIGK
jgi:hypothetical protein